jgi:sirohydrochlorin ferrochelatase
MRDPVVVLVAHGTADEGGRAVLDDLRDAVATRLPSADVRLAFVDVVDPTPATVLAGTRGAVLVPLFLATGHHVSVDIPDAVAGAEAARATDPLGPHPIVVEALADRVHALEPTPGAVVLAAAGSSRAAARAEVETAAQLLAHHLGCPVTAGFLSGPGTTVPEAIDAARVTAASAVLASYVLAPGHFHSKAARLAAEHGLRCTDPIGVHPRVVDLVVRLASSAMPTEHPTEEEARP